MVDRSVERNDDDRATFGIYEREFNDILITEAMVTDQISRLADNKAARTDERVLQSLSSWYMSDRVAAGPDFSGVSANRAGASAVDGVKRDCYFQEERTEMRARKLLAMLVYNVADK